MTFATRYDAVIVGSGHNGLVAAAYLANAGQSVLVLERNDWIGGATASQRVFPDYDAYLSRYAYLISMLPEVILDELGVAFETRRRSIASFTAYDREGAAARPRDLQRRRGAIEGLGTRADRGRPRMGGVPGAAAARGRARVGGMAQPAAADSLPRLLGRPLHGEPPAARSMGELHRAPAGRGDRTARAGRCAARAPPHRRQDRRVRQRT